MSIRLSLCLTMKARTHQKVKTEALNFNGTFRTIMKNAVTNIIKICRRESGQPGPLGRTPRNDGLNSNFTIFMVGKVLHDFECHKNCNQICSTNEFWYTDCLSHCVWSLLHSCLEG